MTDSSGTAVLDDRADEPGGAGSQGPPRQPDHRDNATFGGMSFETLAVCAFIFGIFAIVAAVFAIGMSARAVEVANQGGGGSGSAATASEGGGGGGAASVDVSMKEFAFNPSDINIAENGKIVLKNEGAMDHDFAVEDLTSDMIKPGGDGELELSGLAPGEYKFICTVPGHEAAGMKGTITVG